MVADRTGSIVLQWNLEVINKGKINCNTEVSPHGIQRDMRVCWRGAGLLEWQ